MFMQRFPFTVPGIRAARQRLVMAGMAIAIASPIAAIPTKAWAHSVETNYALDAALQNRLQMQSTFSTGEPFAGATVRIYAPGQSDQPWYEGTMDEQGQFSFAPDATMTGDWEVEIGEDGHADYLRVPVTETGVDVNQISQVGSQDVHYAALPWPISVGGSFAIAAAAGLGLRFQRRRAL
jgi:nickel transport protein